MPIVEAKGVTPPPARKQSQPRATKSASSPADMQAAIRAKRLEGVNDFFGICSAISIGVGWWADAATYQIHSPKIAEGVVKYADDNEKIAAALDKFAEIAPIGEVLSAVLMMGVQLATNHKLLSPQRGAMFGASDPEALAMQMQMRIERDLMEQRAQAEKEMREFQAMREEQDSSG